MLVRSLFLLLLFATVAETIVHGAHAMAQLTLRRQALTGLHDEIASATSSASNAIASALANGGDPRALVPAAPSPKPTCLLTVQSGCAIEGQATVSFVARSSDTFSTCPSGSCTIYEQDNDAVNEGRIGVSIGAQAVTNGGAVLATRTAHLTFRTMRIAPYAALAGGSDTSTDLLDGSGNGDDGGAAPSGPVPGTLIDVLYQNAASGQTMPANVWRSQQQADGITPSAWSP